MRRFNDAESMKIFGMIGADAVRQGICVRCRDEVFIDAEHPEFEIEFRNYNMSGLCSKCADAMYPIPDSAAIDAMIKWVRENRTTATDKLPSEGTDVCNKGYEFESEITLRDLISGNGRCPPGNAKKIPRKPGYYAIFVNDQATLGAECAELLRCRGTYLIYVGIATKSLLARLVEEDLGGRGNSTFFRSLGAILGYRPQGKASNPNNYRFNRDDRETLVKWINQNLSVRWKQLDPLKEKEKALIQTYRPLLNIQHNPDKWLRLEELRAECRAIARA